MLVKLSEKTRFYFQDPLVVALQLALQVQAIHHTAYNSE